MHVIRYTTFIATTLMLAAAASAAPNYIDARREAAKLIGDREYEEALTAFVALANTDAYSDFQKADAFEQAAWCAQRLDRNEQALELAQQIPLEADSKACRMKLLLRTRQWSEIVEQFADADIAAWPDRLKGDAYYARGQAYHYVKQGKLAAADLEQAAIYTMDRRAKESVLSWLGSTCNTLLDDPQAAIGAYRRIYELNNAIWQGEAALKVARIYVAQGQRDLALAELETIEPEAMSNPDSAARALLGIGEILASIGKPEQAAARYREAMQVEKISDRVKALCDKALAALREDSSSTD